MFSIKSILMYFSKVRLKRNKSIIKRTRLPSRTNTVWIEKGISLLRLNANLPFTFNNFHYLNIKVNKRQGHGSHLLIYFKC